jgi:hypothetical protein
MHCIMRGQLRGVLSLLIAASASAVTCPAKADLIVNGGFETGDATGWTTTNIEVPYSGVTQYNTQIGGFIHAHTGTYYASLSDDGTAGTIPGHGQEAEFSQVVVTTPGQNYKLSFWAYIEQSALPGVQFQAYWDDKLLLNIVDPKDELGLPQDIRDHWVNHSFVVTGAASGTDTVAFFGENKPRYNGLDDVSLNVASNNFTTTPLPGNLTMCGIAGASMLCIWYHRRRPTQQPSG